MAILVLDAFFNLKRPVQKYNMAEIYEEILHTARQRWPATYQVLIIECEGPRCFMSAFRLGWVGTTFDILNDRQNGLFMIMDLFEEYYPDLTMEHSPVLAAYPYIGANFTIKIKNTTSPHSTKRYYKLSIYIKGVKLNLGSSNDGFYGPKVDYIEKFLAILAKKRQALRPLPIPIRDAINYHL